VNLVFLFLLAEDNVKRTSLDHKEQGYSKKKDKNAAVAA
jgi:hypothetical protein